MTKPEDLVSILLAVEVCGHGDGDLGINWDVIFKGGDYKARRRARPR